MSKPAKPAETGDQPPKSKKMLIIIIAVVVLVIGGGAGAYFFLNKSDHAAKKEHSAEAGDVAADEGDGGGEDSGEGDGHKVPPKFVELGTFTANLVREESDRYLQATISVKLTKPELEEKVKERNPEILHRINMVLQSKRPSELATIEGKDNLAKEIKAQVEYVLGLRKSAPPIRTSPAPDAEAGQDAHAAPEHKEVSRSKPGVADIFFTSFIIQ